MKTALLSCLTLCLSAATTAFAAQPTPPQIPYYFIAVHNEPFNHTQNKFFTDESYGILTKMIAKADAYNIKLTIMFAPHWADYLLADKERAAALERWKKSGHEISGHHHSVGHGNWDGYSALSRQEAEAWRARTGGHDFQAVYGSETYYGTLHDFTAKLRQINPEIKSGCMNDEGFKNALPDAILYDTCSGFVNFGEPGRQDADPNPEKGRNDYVTVGTVNGIERKWLTHHFMAKAAPAMQVFSSMRSGVHGTVNHSSPHELEEFFNYLDFLHQADPQGEKSRTLTQVIEQKLLPEKKLADAVVNGGIAMPASPPAQPTSLGARHD